MNLGDALIVLGVILILVGSFMVGYRGTYYSKVSSTTRGCDGINFMNVRPGENVTLDLCEDELGNNSRGVLTVNVNLTSNVTGGKAVLLIEKNWSIVKRIIVSGARYVSVNVSGPVTLNVSLVLLSNPNTTVAYKEDHSITVKAVNYEVASLRGVGASLLVAGVVVAGVGVLVGRRRREEPVEDMV